MIRNTAAALSLAVCLLAALTTPALAAKGGGAGAGSGTTVASIALTEDPSFGDTASFAVTYPAMKWTPEVSIECFQNGQEVYWDVTAPSGSGSWTPQLTLWSEHWANVGGGPAECTAKLFYYTWTGKRETGVVYLAQSNFPTS